MTARDGNGWAATPAGVIRLADPAALADLGRYAARARAVDDAGAIRLQASAGVLAAWVGVLPGSGILGEGTTLGLRTVALAEPTDLDVVVPLAAVADRAARHDGSADLPVPPTRALAAWTALTPPRSGWEPAGEVSADELATVAREGVAEVSAAVRERGAAAGFVRDRVWSRDAVPGVRAGGAFALYSLGFLAPGTVVQVLRVGRWSRLTAAGGHVVLR
ncbi:MAG: hypothetical protein ACRCYX_12850 [Dermatophilaceae bacterium]